MKKTFILLSTLAVSATMYAQAPHVFTAANGPKNPVGIDTVYGTQLSSVAATPDAQYHIWDLGQMIIGSYRYYAQFGTIAGFASATHVNKAYVDIAPGIKYETNLAFAIESTGIKTYGERLTRQAFSLAAQSGVPTDSIVILAQDVIYSAPQVQMPYPATIGTKWNSTSKSTTNLTITYTPGAPLPGINNQPAQRKTTTTSTAEVVGWGFLKVKRLDGKSSGIRSVLQVKNTISTTDSLFINGAPAPAILLQAAGLTQGETRIVYQKSYYREYEMLPMLNITYEEATFTTRKDVNVHTQRLPYPDGVNDVTNVAMAEIFPNPSNGTFTVRVPESTPGAWAYQVTDITGKTVATGSLTLSSNKEAQVTLNSTVTPGTYIVTVQHDGTAVSGHKITIQ